MAPPMDFGGLLAKGKKPAAAPALEIDIETEAPDPKMERVLPATRDLMAAMKSGDENAFAEAFIAAQGACAGGYDEGDEV